jgi:hypothetical protein
MAGSLSARVQHVAVAFLNLQFALSSMMAMASDTDPEQDFCVDDLASATVVNGLVCKSPATVTASDFMFHGLANLDNTKNAAGSLSL